MHAKRHLHRSRGVRSCIAHGYVVSSMASSFRISSLTLPSHFPVPRHLNKSILARRRPICSRPKLQTMADDTKSNQKTYHKKATGEALVTAKKHSKDHELKLYGSCFWYLRSFTLPYYPLTPGQPFCPACLDIPPIQGSGISVHRD